MLKDKMLVNPTFNIWMILYTSKVNRAHGKSLFLSWGLIKYIAIYKCG